MNVVAVARDAGAAAALLPVIDHLAAKGAHVRAIGYDRAALAWERADWPVLALEESADVESLVGVLRGWGTTTLLSGTSMKVERDARFWAAADAAAAHCVALVDHWRNLVARFTVERALDHRPPQIAVMDENAAQTLIAAGCPAGTIVVTGQPALDGLCSPTVAARRRARARLGVRDDRQIVLFASEPKSRHGGDPYDEYEVTEMLTRAVEETLPDALLVLKLHPLDRADAFPDLRERAVVVRGLAPAQAIAAADVMVGMTSMLLLEAGLSGVPTISLRPGSPPDDFIDRHTPWIATAGTYNELVVALHARAVPDDSAPRPMDGATSRVAALVR